MGIESGSVLCILSVADVFRSRANEIIARRYVSVVYGGRQVCN